MRFAAVLLVGLSLSFWSPITSAQSNLVPNGDFEAGTEPWNGTSANFTPEPGMISREVSDTWNGSAGSLRLTVQTRPGTSFYSHNSGAVVVMEVIVTAAAPLSEIKGSLRLDPQRGAQGYRTELRVNLWHSAAAAKGELIPRIFIETSDATGVDYSPIYGVFSPEQNLGTPRRDAGARR